ncbi:DNA-deoxyinosine glycosylase [Helicobacter sp. 11S03491-1]|uniref:DNA-deoxyinosine glycosylase n=1 Tax=Helicobacter sp. 11S03491-1 TaxID=1476196 RepID=UPI000BA76A65|nr:DNA-deoxyinosine glycosylase [Helicobacter sp. 11S03491-1]PAF43290.1 DNA-deoxyinosine glycosylase [Helicobacter sp. 11S03491-1]
MREYALKHPLNPVYDEDCKILILGSFPSKKSRESFYYAHSQNRFWKILSRLFGMENLESIEMKKGILLMHHIALWDVVGQCDIQGSSDACIQNVIANDINRILRLAPIKRIFANGKKAGELYLKYSYPSTKQEITVLPSTSAANAKYSLDLLLKEWSVVAKKI